MLKNVLCRPSIQGWQSLSRRTRSCRGHPSSCSATTRSHRL